MDAVLAFEDGSVYRGKGFGAAATSLGEAVFNTSMMGYQELLTDPSNYKNILVMTFVEIGCYGVNGEDAESGSIKAAGMVVAQDCEVPSNWRCEKTLDAYLKENGVPAISGVDTRAITRKIREKGALKACLSTEGISDEEAVAKAKGWKGIDGENLAAQVSCEKPFHFDDSDIKPFELGGVHISKKSRREPLLKCAAIDFGAKESMLKSLAFSGFDITVFPSNTPAQEIEKFSPDCVFLTSGAGDPSALASEAAQVKKLAEKFPTLGVGMGCQILAAAFGAKTKRLPFGHHGGNHPVRNLATDKVRITAQNNAFAVDENSLANSDAVLAEVNVTDGAVAGIRHKSLPAFGVQYHPEDLTGEDFVFDEFYDLVQKRK